MKWLMRICTGVIVLLALLELMNIFMFDDALRADPQKVDQLLADLQPITAPQLAKKIDHPDGKPSFVYIYASWCPYCRKLMPFITKTNATRLTNFNVFMISVDKEPKKLAQYLVARGYVDMFTPYLFLKKDSESLKQVLDARGVGFDGAIPFLAIFDKAGKFRGASTGMGNWEALDAEIKELQGAPN